MAIVWSEEEDVVPVKEEEEVVPKKRGGGRRGGANNKKRGRKSMPSARERAAECVPKKIGPKGIQNALVEICTERIERQMDRRTKQKQASTEKMLNINVNVAKAIKELKDRFKSGQPMSTKLFYGNHLHSTLNVYKRQRQQRRKCSSVRFPFEVPGGYKLEHDAPELKWLTVTCSQLGPITTGSTKRASRTIVLSTDAEYEREHALNHPKLWNMVHLSSGTKRTSSVIDRR